MGRLWFLFLAALTLVTLVAVSVANDFVLVLPTAILWVCYLLTHGARKRAKKSA